MTEFVHVDEPSREMAIQRPKVACGIVTYNPDLERLHENVQAIASQVDNIFVFDNASTNHAEISECLEEDYGVPVTLFRSPENRGMAVALNKLSKMALEGGYEYILLLDQDSVSTEGMVEALLSHMNEGVAIVGPLLQDRNNETSEKINIKVRDASRVITSGSLLFLPAFEETGGYDERLFVDWVDVEFCDNLRTHGWTLKQTSDAVLIHEKGHQEPVFRGPGKENLGDRKLNRIYYRTNHPAWRVEDRARGQVITMRKYFGTRIFFEEFGIYMKNTVAKCLLLEKNKTSLIRAIARGTKRGITEY